MRGRCSQLRATPKMVSRTSARRTSTIIRRCFHKQLKQLWATNRFLKDHRMVASNRFGIQKYPNGNIDLGSVSDLDEPMSEVIANLYRENGYRFLPLWCAPHLTGQSAGGFKH